MPFVPFRFESRHIFNTTLPKGLPSIWYRSASTASSRANVRATIGFIAPDSSNVKIDAHAVLHIFRRLCKKRETLYAGALPDEIGNVDSGFAAGGIAQRRQTAAHRKRAKRLAQYIAAHRIDHNVRTIASRDTPNAFAEFFRGEIYDLIEAQGSGLFRLCMTRSR